MKIVSVINYKGGVGKTSLTANLAAELAWRNRRILLLDLDSQSSLTFSFITPDEWLSDFSSNKTIKNWFDTDTDKAPPPLSNLRFAPPRVHAQLGRRKTLDLIPSHLGLINVDLELATRLAGANLPQSKRNFIRVHRILANGLQEIKELGEYDIVLVDCPPNFNIVTKTAIIASDYILVPTRPDNLSTLGIEFLIRSIEQLIREYNEYVKVDSDDKFEEIKPKIIGAVFTMVQEYRQRPISAQNEFIAKLRSKSAISVFDSYIKRNDTLFANAPQYGTPVVLTSYANRSHQSVVDGLEAVADEFEHHLGI